MTITPFGKAVRKARIDADVSLSDMAAALGVTPAFLSSVESGRKKVPADLVKKVNEFLSARDVGVSKLGSLADISNESVSLEGLDPEHQMFVSDLARASWNNLDAEELENLKTLLRRLASK